MNDGPLCRCSSENMHFGIRHNIYPGEKVVVVVVVVVHFVIVFFVFWSCEELLHIL